MENLLEVKHLTVTYRTEASVVQAVNNITFTLAPGETLGLVGETGAGKTTTAKAILRILQEPPAQIDEGEIIFKGQNLLDLSEKEMRKIRGKEISMIFQDPMTALNPMEPVGEQIAEAIKLHDKSLNKIQVKEKAMELLEMVEIPAERYQEYPHQFSGGMKQRVVIAMALACSPTLLLADEPTTALDVTIQAQVLELMKELREKFHSSTILITHDLGIIAHNADKVAVMYAGYIMEIGTLEDIFDHGQHPYTIGLFNSVPNLDMQNKRLATIPGLMPDPANLPDGCPFAPRCSHATEECKHGKIRTVEVTPGHFVRCIMAKE